jgi:hypothetical protein
VVAQLHPTLRLSAGAEAAHHPIVTMRVSDENLDGSRNLVLDEVETSAPSRAMRWPTGSPRRP